MHIFTGNKTAFLIMSLVVLLAIAGTANAVVDPRCGAVAKTFFEAYMRHDMPVVRNLLAEKDEHQFGVYPFQTLAVGNTAVDENQALVSFTATVKGDTKLSRGGLLCYRQDGKWKVRQILFFNKVPIFFPLPLKSRTANDKRDEPMVSKLGDEFLAAWKDGDYAAMNARWYNWPNRDDDPIRGLSIKNFQPELTAPMTTGILLRFKSTLSYRLGIFNITSKVGTGLFMVNEGGEWRVRGNIMAFEF